MIRQRIETHSGLAFDYADPQPVQICVEDIAHALAHICRFGGHIHHFYSVANHAMLVRQLVVAPQAVGVEDLEPHPELGFPALHHDSAEAYTMDLPKPLKNAMECMGFRRDQYSKMSQRVDRAIGEHLGINPEDFKHPAIKKADEAALRMEATALKINDGRSFAELCGVEPLEPASFAGLYVEVSPAEVEHLFLMAHESEARCLVS